MKRRTKVLLVLLAIFVLAVVAIAQNASVFPARAVTASDLFVASNYAATTLITGISDTATSATVASTTGFTAPQLVTIDGEVSSVCQVSGGNTLIFGTAAACPSVTGRGYDSTVAVSHLASRPVQGRVVAWLHNQISAELIAIEATLGITVSDVAYSTLSAACSAAQSQSRELILNKQWTGQSTLNCSAPAVAFRAGGLLKPASGQTVTMIVRDAPLTQICDVSAGGTCAILAPKLHPQWWGAAINGQLGAGAHDDTAALQAAVSDGIANGLEVDPPSGVIKITAPIDITATAACNFQMAGVPAKNPCGLKIHGQGVGKTGIWQATPGADAITALPGAPQYPFYELEGFSLYGPDGGTCPGTSGHGIHIAGGQKVTVRGVYVMGFCGAGKDGIWLDGPEGATVGDVRVDFSDTGVKLTSSANIEDFYNVQTSFAYTAGFDFNLVTGGHFSGLSAQSGNCDGMKLQRITAAKFDGLYFEANNKAGNCYAVRLLSGVRNNKFDGLYLASAQDTMLVSGTSGATNLATRNWFFSGDGADGNQGVVTIDNAYSVGNYWVNYLNPGSFQNTGVTASAGAGSFTLVASSARPIYVGQTIACTGVPGGTTIGSVSGSTGAGFILGISNATTAPLVSTACTIGGAGFGSEIFIGQSGSGAATSFTPVLTFGDGNTPPGCTAPTYVAGNQTGDYVATNGLIAANVRISLSNKGTCTGIATVTGMPAPGATVQLGPAPFLTALTAVRTGLTTRTVGTGIQFDVDYGQSGQLHDTDFTNATVMRASIAYHQ